MHPGTARLRTGTARSGARQGTVTGRFRSAALTLIRTATAEIVSKRVSVMEMSPNDSDHMTPGALSGSDAGQRRERGRGRRRRGRRQRRRRGRRRGGSGGGGDAGRRQRRRRGREVCLGRLSAGMSGAAPRPVVVFCQARCYAGSRGRHAPPSPR